MKTTVNGPAKATSTVDAPRADGPEATRMQRAQSLRLSDSERRAYRRGRRVGRWLVLAAMLALAAAAAVYGPPAYDDYRLRRVLECDALSVAPSSSEDVALSLSGYLRPSSMIVISPRVAGIVVEAPVEVGERVRRGDLLAAVDSTTFQADYDQALSNLALYQSRLSELENGAQTEEIAEAEASLDQAIAHHELRKKEFERATELYRNKSISRKEWEFVDAELKQAEARERSLRESLKLIRKGPRAERIDAARAEVDRARATLVQSKYFLDNVRMIAPADATVLEKHAEVGETVRPDVLLTNAFTLADLSQMEAEVELQERDLGRVRVGSRCRIVPDAYPDRAYQGAVVRFHPQVNRQRGVVEVRVRVESPDDALLPNMNCRVEFLVDETDSNQKLHVPVEAVLRDNGGPHVFVVENDVAVRRNVEVGPTVMDRVEIATGLKAGDILLYPGVVPLRDGQRVRPRTP